MQRPDCWCEWSGIQAKETLWLLVVDSFILCSTGLHSRALQALHISGRFDKLGAKGLGSRFANSVATVGWDLAMHIWGSGRNLRPEFSCSYTVYMCMELWKPWATFWAVKYTQVLTLTPTSSHARASLGINGFLRPRMF